MLPFSVEEFFAVFADYNESIWPMQWVLLAIAIAIVALTMSRLAHKNRLIDFSLAFLWAWMGVAYHLIQFTRINPAAYVFSAAFVGQGALFVWHGVAGKPLAVSYRPGLRTAAGTAMLAYALIAYPALNSFLGHVYPHRPTFGAPCPTTIFTLGLLTLARGRHQHTLSIIPLLWSLIGGSAAYLLGVWQDIGLLVTGLIATPLVAFPGRQAAGR
jgi:hypothetical protein